MCLERNLPFKEINNWGPNFVVMTHGVLFVKSPFFKFISYILISVTSLNSIESLNPGTPSIIFSEPENSPAVLQSPKSQDFSNTVEAYFRQIQDEMKKLREELQTQFVKNQEEIHNLKLKHQAEIQVLELKNQKLEMALDLKNQKYENALQAHNDLLAGHFQRNNSQS